MFNDESRMQFLYDASTVACNEVVSSKLSLIHVDPNQNKAPTARPADDVIQFFLTCTCACQM